MRESLKRNEHLDKMIYILSFIASVLFLLLFSKSTSPLYPYFYSSDSGIFMLLGQMFLDGKTPYVDFFDHKGPVIIFIEAISQSLIWGRTGVFIIQIVSLFSTLVVLCKAVQIFTQSKSLLLATILIFLLFLRLPIRFGNQTEEYSLFFIVLALYYTLLFYFKDDRQISTIRTLVLGLCFSVPFWLRANNAGVICACAVFIFYILLREKDWRSAIKFVMFFTLSILLFSLIIILYFQSIGALDEMIYAAFTHNFMYVDDAPNVFQPKLFVIFLGLSCGVFCILFAGAYSLYKKSDDANMIVFSVLLFILALLPLCIGRFFYTYLILITPIAVLGCLFYIASNPKIANQPKKIWIVIMCISVLIIVSIFAQKVDDEGDRRFIRNINSMMSQIPRDERDSVYMYNIFVPTYIITDIKPTGKYFILQDVHARVDKRIYDEIDSFMILQKPKWVLIETDDALASTVANKRFNEIVARDYILIDQMDNQSSAFWLFKREE